MPELVQKLSYTHEAMADMLLANPTISQRELARAFGYTEGWISRLISSDGFQALLHSRKNKLLDPILAGSLDEQIRGLALQSVNIVRDKLDAAPTLDGAVKVLELSTRALGYGARGSGDQNNVQINNYVVNVPPKSANPSQWLEANKPARALPSGAAIDVEAEK